MDHSPDRGGGGLSWTLPQTDEISGTSPLTDRFFGTSPWTDGFSGTSPRARGLIGTSSRTGGAHEPLLRLMGSQEPFLELRGFLGPLLRPMGSQGLLLGLRVSQGPSDLGSGALVNLSSDWRVLRNLFSDRGLSWTSPQTKGFSTGPRFELRGSLEPHPRLGVLKGLSSG